MQASLLSVERPRWSNAEKTAIDCFIKTSQFGDEELPFTASANDVEAHGRAIFVDIVSGTYGEILEFIPPPPPPQITATPASGEMPSAVL